MCKLEIAFGGNSNIHVCEKSSLIVRVHGSARMRQPAGIGNRNFSVPSSTNLLQYFADDQLVICFSATCFSAFQ